MSQEIFEKSYENEWDKFDKWIDSANRHRLDPDESSTEIPHVYRRICHHLSIAKHRMYSPYLVARLNKLVLKGHSLIYRTRAGVLTKIIRFLFVDFPRAVRSEVKLFAFACVLFFGTLIGVAVLVQYWPEFTQSVLSEDDMSKFEEMYNPMAERFGRSRTATSNFEMFGHYIRNNIGISFRIFAGGFIFGLGAIFFLLFQGIVLGAVVGYLIHIKYTVTIMSFTAGHGPFELTAIALAGCAGIKLGLSIINPERFSRVESLKRAAKICITLMWGVMVMLLIAAFIEAYWSSITTIEPLVKYSVGGALWFFVITYFIFAGRRYGSR